jgi:hypothetical protein
MKAFKYWFIITLAGILSASCSGKGEGSGDDYVSKYLTISKKDARYFADGKGNTWIPIQTNYLPYKVGNGSDDEPSYVLMEDYIKKFADNGGNLMRVWISTDFLEIEDEQEGLYNPTKFQRIDKLLELADKYGVYIKFCLQHIRSIDGAKSSWDNSKVLAAKFKSIREYISTPEGIHSYLNRARALAEKYNANPRIFAWELWNEMDALPSDLWPSFTKSVLDSVKILFPNQLVLQTLGSLHSTGAEANYRKLFTYPNNQFVSVHRYLEQGNDWGQYSYIKGDVDTLVYTAMRFVRTYVKDRPIVVNEIGAVEPNHIGPSLMYKKDKDGMLIHDMVFAPFFCGAAGSGGMWHWDHYIYPGNLWYHFGRFANAIDGFDPVAESCEPFTFLAEGVRCFGLKGKTKTIIWCRDTANNWQTELVDGTPPPVKSNLAFNPQQIGANSYTKVRVYDPWKDNWSTVQPGNDGSVNVPAFQRSVVVSLE